MAHHARVRRVLLDEVQRIVETLAESLGRSVMVDDVDLDLIAGSRHFGDEDPYRISVVLARGAGPEASAYFRRFDLFSGDAPVRVPANPELGLHARICYPLRCAGTALGGLWLIDDGGPVDDERITAACTRLARVLHERRHSTALDEPLLTTLLQQLVRGVEPRRVLDLLRDEPFVDPSRRYQVAVTHPGDRAGGPARLGRLAQRDALLDRTVDHRVLTVEGFDVLVTAVRRAAPSATAAHVHAQTPEIGRPHDEAHVPAGLSDTGELQDLRALFVQAALAAFAAHHLDPPGGGSDVTRWADLGPLGPLLIAAERRSTTRTLTGLEDLLDADRSGTVAPTLTAYLRHGGDTTATAATLVVHRTTLRYRLDQIRAKTGLDLDDGRIRAAAQLMLLARDVRESGLLPFLATEDDRAARSSR